MPHDSMTARRGQPSFDLNVSDSKRAQAEFGGVARRGRRRRAAQGLSTAHISPFLRKDRLKHFKRLCLATGEVLETTHLVDAPPLEHLDGSAVLWDGGNLVKCKRPYSTSTNSKHGGGRRGRVTDFTRASRRNLLRTTAKVQRDQLPLFVTFTYPGRFSPDPKQWKRDLDTWVKRLHRRYPAAGLIWRLEPQKRLAPHYHVLVWGVIAADGDLSDFRSWVSESWYEVVGSEDERHLRAGTRVERIRSARGVMAYAGKYLAKLPAAPIEGSEDSENLPDWSAGVGRWWGVRYPENIPWAKEVPLTLAGDVAMRLMDALIAASGLPEGSWRTVTVFAVGAEWLEWLREMGALAES
jgi:hypothetical protein